LYIGGLWYCHSLQVIAPVKKELQFFLNRCTGQSPAESDDTRGCIYIQLRPRPPEDEQGNARNM